jgi:hypothetical protein
VEQESQQLQNARALAANAGAVLAKSGSFQRLNAATQQAIYRDLDKIGRALQGNGHTRHDDPYSFPLDTPADRFRRVAGNAGGAEASQDSQPSQQSPPADSSAPAPSPRAAATETIARRAGALSDEINFPAFVASLVHGTYDAVVDASIRQMEAFAGLVSAVAKDLDQFTAENVSRGQVLDWLAHQYPHDLMLDVPVGPNAAEPALHPRQAASGEDGDTGPSWLADYGLEGPLTDDLIEEQLIPAARKKVGENRLQMLATMVLLGMNRINVKDGSISAKVRFRAAALDHAQVDYAVTQDPGNQAWGSRGSATYDQHTTMVSTVGVNVQSDSDLKAELFGEVKINFVSETLPLDRFVDSARMAILQKNGRPTVAQGANAPQQNPAPPQAPADVSHAGTSSPQPANPSTAPAAPGSLRKGGA